MGHLTPIASRSHREYDIEEALQLIQYGSDSRLGANIELEDF